VIVYIPLAVFSKISDNVGGVTSSLASFTINTLKAYPATGASLNIILVLKEDQ
jgi:hypothetical protein